MENSWTCGNKQTQTANGLKMKSQENLKKYWEDKQKINKAKLHQIKNKASFQPRKASTKWKDNSQNERKAYMNYEIPLRDTIMYYWSSRRREGKKGQKMYLRK